MVVNTLGRERVEFEENLYILVDTKGGVGYDIIMEKLEPFIIGQSYKFSFPGMSQEDLAQDIRVLILEAIPNFNSGKNMTMAGFLRGHVRNRLINKCHFVSKQKRIATHDAISRIKTRCPNCKNFETASPKDEYFECFKCGYTSMMSSSKVKKYNFPVEAINSSAVIHINKNKGEWDCENSWIESVPDREGNIFNKAEPLSPESITQVKFDFERIRRKMNDKEREALSRLLEGRVSRRNEEKIFARIKIYLEE